MPWNEGAPSPWGNGGRRPPPPQRASVPDLDRLMLAMQGMRRFGGGGVRGPILLVLVAVGLWLASGLYRVQPDEVGVVMRFGAFTRTTGPGLNYHLPWPIESVERPAVTHINRIEIGYRSTGPDVRPRHDMREVGEESLMLTGDENIVDINFTVFWRIADAPAFLFNTRDPIGTVKSAAESSMREVMGRTPIQPALTGARAQIEAAVLKSTQGIMDRYKAGVEITQVQLQKVDPPAAVVDSFRDVQRANTDAERARNEADAYRNDIVPRARGDAARIVAEADGARQSSVAEATGQAQRFGSVLAAYRAARDVTMRRLYIETMAEVLKHTPTTVIDGAVRNLLPMLPLDQAPRPAPAARVAPPAAGSPAPFTPTPSGPNSAPPGPVAGAGQ